MQTPEYAALRARLPSMAQPRTFTFNYRGFQIRVYEDNWAMRTYYIHRPGLPNPRLETWYQGGPTDWSPKTISRDQLRILADGAIARNWATSGGRNDNEFGWLAVDGIPWEVHMIHDTAAREAATKAYRRARL